MTEQNPFEAAQEILLSHTCRNFAEASAVRKASDVLEAAGRVEPEGLAFFLRQRNLLMPSSVRVLLSALPDKEPR
jgi:hypothetical protein